MSSFVDLCGVLPSYRLYFGQQSLNNLSVIYIMKNMEARGNGCRLSTVLSEFISCQVFIYSKIICVSTCMSVYSFYDRYRTMNTFPTSQLLNVNCWTDVHTTLRSSGSHTSLGKVYTMLLILAQVVFLFSFTA